ncbi:MAG: hypothetical protein RBU37_04070 [Myxococcota bacterium]|jgi:hypothetical protein|nr:hypothetical protein [Myxococcota bacterium]
MARTARKLAERSLLFAKLSAMLRSELREGEHPDVESLDRRMEALADEQDRADENNAQDIAALLASLRELQLLTAGATNTPISDPRVSRVKHLLSGVKRRQGVSKRLSALSEPRSDPRTPLRPSPTRRARGLRARLATGAPPRRPASHRKSGQKYNAPRRT